jgi:hypothetical protein
MIRASVVLTVLMALLPVQLAAENAASRREEALAFIEFPWQQLNYDIVFMPPRIGFRAMTFPKVRRIEIYARPTDDSRLLAYDIAHELGHAIDMSFNTEETRRKWMELRGIDPETPWFGCSRCSDYNTPAGDFAETFALLLFGSKNFSGRIAPAPTAGQLAVLRPFFEGWFLLPASLATTIPNTNRSPKSGQAAKD